MKGEIKRILICLTAMMLTAKMGVFINKYGYTETYYNLDMTNVINRTDQELGLTGLYWIRGDGIKMYGPWVIVAAHPSVTRYSLVETSRGTGIVMDTHTKDNKKLIDLATTW